MPTFRAYLLDPRGRITWGEWIEAADLEEAETKARALCDAGSPTVELWQGSQRMADVPCDPKAPVRHAAEASR